MLTEISKYLETLCNLPGPPGNEQLIRDLLIKQIFPVSHKLEVDALGNLTAVSGQSGGYKIGVLAHMDEVGLIVSKISKVGLLSFEKVGNIDDRMLLGREVDVMTEDNRLIRGVIGSKSQHLQSSEDLKTQKSHRHLFIEVGANSYNEVIDLGINVGSGVVFTTKYKHLEGNNVLAKALDNRIGCLVLTEAIKAIGTKLKNTELYGMYTIQEEIGAKGARVVAFDVEPDLIITLDTVPVKNPEDYVDGDTDLGKGPVIRIFDWHPSTKMGMFTNKQIKERLLDVANSKGIPHQIDVLTSTYLDSSQAHLTAGGIPGGSICFPRRYAHTPVEISNLTDIKSSIDLLVAFIENVDKNPIKFIQKIK